MRVDAQGADLMRKSDFNETHDLVFQGNGYERLFCGWGGAWMWEGRE